MNNLYGGDANDHSWNIPDAEQADADWVQTIPDSEYVALLEGKPCGQGENRKYGANLAGECARLQHEIPEENARADRQVARNGLTVHHTREILRNLGYGNEGELDEELVQAGHRARRAAFSMLGRPFDTDALAAVSVFHSEHSRDENLAHYAFNARCLVSDNIETATKLATCVPLVAAEKYKEPVTSLMCISIAEIADLEAIRAIEQQHAEEMQQAELLLDLNETLNANEPVEQATETQVEGGKTPTAQQQPEVPAIEINDNDIYAFIASGVGVPEPEAFDPHALLKGQILKENDIADWQVKTGMPQVAYAEEI
ncbi:MAG TPA: hypothetical protein VIJ25_15355, partial [Methylococcales bacterium]